MNIKYNIYNKYKYVQLDEPFSAAQMYVDAHSQRADP